MRLSVAHTTHYRFDPPKRGVVQSLRLWPARFEGQVTLEWSVTVEGASRGGAFRDGAGDWIETASLVGPVAGIAVEVAGIVETTDLAGVLRGHRETVPPMAYLRETRATHVGPELAALSRDTLADVPEDDGLARAHALSAAVTREIAYMPGSTLYGTSAAEALSQGQGVCQDQAHALISLAIAAGIPARYVTGYLHTSENNLSAAASHAWAELHVPRLGWVGFDATNGCCPDDRYIRLGSGHDALLAAPIRGMADGLGTETLDIELSVTEAPEPGQSQQ